MYIILNEHAYAYKKKYRHVDLIYATSLTNIQHAYKKSERLGLRILQLNLD